MRCCDGAPEHPRSVGLLACAANPQCKGCKGCKGTEGSLFGARPVVQSTLERVALDPIIPIIPIVADRDQALARLAGWRTDGLIDGLID